MLGCTPILRRSTLALVALFLAFAPVRAAVPADPASRAAFLGQPAALQVKPETILLNGPRAMQQVVVTGRYADGTIRDLTSFCDLSVEAADVATVSATGFVQPQK